MKAKGGRGGTWCSRRSSNSPSFVAGKNSRPCVFVCVHGREKVCVHGRENVPIRHSASVYLCVCVCGRESVCGLLGSGRHATCQQVAKNHINYARTHTCTLIHRVKLGLGCTCCIQCLVARVAFNVSSSLPEREKEREIERDREK